MSKEDFKAFVSNKPELARYVNNGKMTWQKFYEIYNLYGENSHIWDDYIKKDKDDRFKFNDIIKNVDINSIKEHIDTAQKALSFVQELASKGTGKSVSNVINNPRPLNKFFED